MKASRRDPASEPAVVGSGPRLLLIHGSIANAQLMWMLQRPLADSFALVMPNRSGYPPHAPLERIDFDRQADELAPLLGEGSHVVGFSYGGVVAMLVAARRLDAVRSLTLIEPPALWLGRGNPDVDRLALETFRLYWSGPREPLAFAKQFLALYGGKIPLPKELPPDLEQGVRALMAERPPWDARIPLDELAAAPFPKLVFSGAHSPALDAVCDVLEQRLGAERVVLGGGGHNIPLLGTPFNEALAAFVERAESRAPAQIV